MKPPAILPIQPYPPSAISSAPPVQVGSSGGLFRHNDRWAVVGDSLSQNGTYYAWVYLYYATRFPKLALDACNCGISGDSAEGALCRYAWDIQPKHATVATVMMGMNDVDRGLYGDAPPTADILKRREDALARYRANMTELAGKLKADGARLVFLSPAPFDETADIAIPRQTGVNGALAECGRFMRELAATLGGAVIDLHTPMTRLNQRLQKDDPKASIVGPDRIHPAAPGHFVIAYHILKGQNAPGLVSLVDIDGRTGRLVNADNATITGLALKEGAVAFTALEGALPYPIHNDCISALSWVPFERDFNREILRVSGLSPGLHALVIDGEPVGEFEAAEFDGGLNLASLRNTPQARQSAAVLDLVSRWQKTIAERDRGVAQVEHWQFRNDPHPIRFEAVRPRLEELRAKLKISELPLDQYFHSVTDLYLRVKPRESESEHEIAEIVALIRKAAQPVPHQYLVRPVVR